MIVNLRQEFCGKYLLRTSSILYNEKEIYQELTDIEGRKFWKKIDSATSPNKGVRLVIQNELERIIKQLNVEGPERVVRKDD